LRGFHGILAWVVVVIDAGTANDPASPQILRICRAFWPLSVKIGNAGLNNATFGRSAGNY
jgi:hypothetical protein